MVNKFGDCVPREISNLPPIRLLKKVRYIKGKFSDYQQKIIASYRIGCTPYRITATQSALPVYTYSNKVFSNGSICIDKNTFQHITTVFNHVGQLCATEDITHIDVTNTDSLVIFEKVDVSDDGGEIVGIQGAEGLTGKRGPIGEKGERGAKGEPGDSGVTSMARWFPSQTIDWLRENESCCYYFKERDDFIWDKEKPPKIIGFKSHSKSGNDAINLKPMKASKRTKLPSGRGYCLEFSDSLFKVENVELANGYSSYSVLILTFKLDQLPTGEQYLITTETGDRAVSVKGRDLQISGFTYDMKFLYNFRQWNTLFVQWTNMGDMIGWVYFGGKGVALTTTSIPRREAGIFIGAKKDKSHPFVGCLAALEVYEAVLPPDSVFPKEFRELLIKSQKDMVRRL